jgi:hypothetical protein
MKTQKAFAVLLGASALAAVVALPRTGVADEGVSFRDGNGQVSVDVHDGDHHHRHWLHHEEIDAAMAKLGEARGHLDRGGHEFGGHRVRAIKAVDRALAECRAAVDFANSHER